MSQGSAGSNGSGSRRSSSHSRRGLPLWLEAMVSNGSVKKATHEK